MANPTWKTLKNPAWLRQQIAAVKAKGQTVPASFPADTINK